MKSVLIMSYKVLKKLLILLLILRIPFFLYGKSLLSPPVADDTISIFIEHSLQQFPEGPRETGRNPITTRRQFLRTGLKQAAVIAFAPTLMPLLTKAAIEAIPEGEAFLIAAQKLRNYYIKVRDGKDTLRNPSEFENSQSLADSCADRYGVALGLKRGFFAIHHRVYNKSVSRIQIAPKSLSVSEQAQVFIDVLDDLINSRTSAGKITSYATFFSSKLFKEFISHLHDGNISAMGDPSVERFLKQAHAVDKELASRMEAIIQTIIEYQNKFYSLYFNALDDNDVDNTLRAYIREAQKRRYRFITSNSSELWNQVANTFRVGTITTDLDSRQQLYGRHSELLDNIDAQIGGERNKIDKLWKDLNKVLEKERFFVYISHRFLSPYSFYMLAYRMLNRNTYAVANEEFSSSRLLRIDAVPINLTSLGLAHGENKDILILDQQIQERAKRIVQALTPSSGEKLILVDYTGPLVRNLNKRVINIINKKTEKFRSEQELLEIIFYDIENHESQHIIDDILGVIRKLYGKDKGNVKSEQSAYSTEIAVSRVPFLHFIELFNMFIAPDGERYYSRTYCAQIFREYISDYGVKKAGFTQQELSMFEKIDINTDEGEKIAIKILDWMEQLDVSKLKELAYNHHVRITKRKPLEGRKVITKEDFHASTVPVQTSKMRLLLGVLLGRSL